jgi:hypothetical protein
MTTLATAAAPPLMLAKGPGASRQSIGATVLRRGITWR